MARVSGHMGTWKEAWNRHRQRHRRRDMVKAHNKWVLANEHWRTGTDTWALAIEHLLMGSSRAGRFYFFTHFYSLLLTSQFRIDQKRSTKNTHRSKTISPNLNRSKTINPNLNRSKTIRPKIGEEENEQKRATNKDFKECLQK